MTTKLLLPHRYKFLGWCLLIPATIIGIILITTDYEGLAVKAKVFSIYSEGVFDHSRAFSMIETNITNTVVGALFIVGAMLVGFSKEKSEDEFISELRTSSLLWAVWVNYALLLFAMLFIYGMTFLNVMIYNMFTVLLIFIGRFNYILYKNSKTVSDEKYSQG